MQLDLRLQRQLRSLGFEASITLRDIAIFVQHFSPPAAALHVLKQKSMHCTDGDRSHSSDADGGDEDDLANVGPPR